jgi:AAA+ ATPase superfamily predicted ATPase
MFLDRHKEKRRLLGALAQAQPTLVVLYGRRRTGKSTLLKQVLGLADVYFVADQGEAHLQRAKLATEIGRRVPGFERAVYPDWDALLQALAQVAQPPRALVLDEFPYLVKNAPELPSVLQKWVDNAPARPHLVLCGSAQHLMRDLTLEGSAPLFGRADEVLHVRPLSAGWLPEFLGVAPAEAVNEYAAWGGIPRYWELRRRYASHAEAVRDLLLDKDGVLHEEPLRLFLDDMRSAVQAYSIVSLVGGGCHRLSEIAARLQKPAAQLAGPLHNLVSLGYLRRDIPFGEMEKNTKRSLYQLADPFLRFYFAFVAPNRSRLALGLTDAVWAELAPRLPAHVGHTWEHLARESVPTARYFGVDWGPARRWWQGNCPEVDLVAQSLDGTALLLGECKLAEGPDPARALALLQQKTADLPFVQGKKLYHGLWSQAWAGEADVAGPVFGAGAVLGALRG